MIRIIKLGEVIYENIEPVVQEVVDFDEEGNPTQFQEIWVVPNDVTELSKAMADTLVWLAGQRLKGILNKYSYYSLADVQFYANQNDEEALQLLDWYQAYDDAIWNWIDNEVSNITDLDNLLNLDMKAIEQQIFDQAIQIKPLP